MSVGFGFSAGDFIAALELVATVVDALRESGEASHRYRELVRQLYTLETALLQVKRLELDESQHSEYIALQQAASQCQRTIDDFWKKIQKYQGPLGAGSGSGASRVKKGWMKIRWAVCRTEDVAAFKADLVAHTESIQLLLMAIEMSRTKIAEKKNAQRQLSLAGRLQKAYFECMKKIQIVADTATSGIEQGRQLIAATSKILEMNVSIFQMVLNIQNIITRIPAQVERNQPVYLIDALGKCCPFHLEFIHSAEAFTAVIQTHFSKGGQARQKVQRGEFVIQNSITGRDIDISQDWQSSFYPGQKVEMSLVFQRRWQPQSTCPGCRAICTGHMEKDIRCSNCDITFRRIIQIEDDGFETNSESFSEILSRQDSETTGTGADTPEPMEPLGIDAPGPFLDFTQLQEMFDDSLAPKKRKREIDYCGFDELEIHEENIRRVRVQTTSRGVTKRFRALFGYFEEGGVPEPAFCYGFRTSEDDGCLIIEFEDTEKPALCDTINEQAFKLGGLFHTELVEASATQEDDSLQITWMEEEEVQMYLRFYKVVDRDIVWDFISSARTRTILRYGGQILVSAEDSVVPEKRPLSPGANEDTSFEYQFEETFPSFSNGASFSFQHAFDPSTLWEQPIPGLEPSWSLTSAPLSENPFALPPISHNDNGPRYPLFPEEPEEQRHRSGTSDFQPYQFTPNNDLMIPDTAPLSIPSASLVEDLWPPALPSNAFPIPPDPEVESIAVKRARNTLAARKSRQRKAENAEQIKERIAKLEAERDHWKNAVLGTHKAGPDDTLNDEDFK